jgi:alpha-N-acetylglucosaminidase
VWKQFSRPAGLPPGARREDSYPPAGWMKSGRDKAYYGKPWIWNMLHNFGGNISLWGRMRNAAQDPAAALHDSTSGKISGIGLTMEGIEQNPALYHLMLENVWRDSAIDIAAWLPQYTLQRYGVKNDSINKAWQILERTVYNGGLGEGGPESIIVARPTLDVFGDRVRTKLDYRPDELVSAWKLFVEAAPALQHSDGFQYDLVDITRQVLANYATPLQQKWVQAYIQYDTTAFDQYTRAFLELMDDMDQLLATRTDFLLGKWIADARSCGMDSNEKDLYELNARNLVTLWGDKESELHEYANRQWAGLIKGFYKPRWEQFFEYLRAKVILGARMEMNDFDAAVKNWEWQWVTGRDVYPATPTGNAVEVATALYNKYGK